MQERGRKRGNKFGFLSAKAAFLCLALALLCIVPTVGPIAAGDAEGYTFTMCLITLTPPPENPEALDVFCQLEPVEDGEILRDPPTMVLDATQGADGLLAQLHQLQPNFEYELVLSAQGTATYGEQASAHAISEALPVVLGDPIIRELSFVAAVGVPDAEGWCDFHLRAMKTRYDEAVGSAYPATIDSGDLPRKAKMGGTYVSFLSEWCARAYTVDPDQREVVTRLWPGELVLFSLVPSKVIVQWSQGGDSA